MHVYVIFHLYLKFCFHVNVNTSLNFLNNRFFALVHDWSKVKEEKNFHPVYIKRYVNVVPLINL